MVLSLRRKKRLLFHHVLRQLSEQNFLGLYFDFRKVLPQLKHLHSFFCESTIPFLEQNDFIVLIDNPVSHAMLEYDIFCWRNSLTFILSSLVIISTSFGIRRFEGLIGGGLKTILIFNKKHRPRMISLSDGLLIFNYSIQRFFLLYSK